MSYSKKVNSYYEDKRADIEEAYDIKKNYNHKYSKDKNKRQFIELYERDNEKENPKAVFKGEYEMIGVYNLSNSVWYWAWSLDFVDHRKTKQVEKVRDLGAKLNKKYSDYDPKEADYLNFISSNGNFYTSPDRLMNVVKIAMYETKAKWFIPILHLGNEETYVHSEGTEIDKDAKKFQFLLVK